VGDETIKRSKNILVVSDNRELSLFLKKEVEAIQLQVAKAVRMDFRYSTANLDPSQMIEFGAGPIDLKAPEMVDQIVREYDLVLSVHCKQIFPKRLVENVRCINVHPGFNPFNRGWYPQAFSLVNGFPIGATIHIMTAEVDHGGIVDQEQVSIDPCDTSLELYRKIIETEKVLIHRNIAVVLSGGFHAVPPKYEGNYNSIDDYRALCRLDLSDQGTLERHLNLLRATSHGTYRNAYFLGLDGRKYFVKITIATEGPSGDGDFIR
jgi:methionyl-tRNA formyltransferase